MTTNHFCINCGMCLDGHDRFCNDCLESKVAVPFLKCWDCPFFEWGASTADLPVGNCVGEECAQGEPHWDNLRRPTLYELIEAQHAMYRRFPQWDLMRNIYSYRVMAALMGWEDKARPLEVEIRSVYGRDAMVNNTNAPDGVEVDAWDGDVFYMDKDQLMIEVEVLERVKGEDFWDSILNRRPIGHETFTIPLAYIGTLEYRAPTEAYRAKAIYQNWKRRHRRQWRQLYKEAWDRWNEQYEHRLDNPEEAWAPRIILVQAVRRQLLCELTEDFPSTRVLVNAISLR